MVYPISEVSLVFLFSISLLNRDQLIKLLDIFEQLYREHAVLKKENQELKDENNRLKGEQGKRFCRTKDSMVK